MQQSVIFCNLLESFGVFCTIHYNLQNIRFHENLNQTLITISISNLFYSTQFLTPFKLYSQNQQNQTIPLILNFKFQIQLELTKYFYNLYTFLIIINTNTPPQSQTIQTLQVLAYNPIFITMTQKPLKPIISNLNYCAKLDQPIDLAQLAHRWIQLEPIKYTLLPIPRVLIHCPNGAAINISPEGSIVILGKIYPKEAQELILSIQKKVGMYFGKKISFVEEPRVASLMASAKLPFSIDIGQLMLRVSKCNRSKRNPGIWWKIGKFGIKTVGIFASGSLQLCGAQSIQGLNESYQQLKDFLYSFRKVNQQ